jgi:hypothetical protein
VAFLVGDLLSADERRSRDAEEALEALEGERRRALEAHARRIPAERDPRWLSVIEANGLRGGATEAERLDLLVWRASRDRPSAAPAREALAEAARRDPAPLVERLTRASGPAAATLARALGEARAEAAVPALLALYRSAKTAEERRAASAALGAVAGDALRPRVDGTPEEIEEDARRVEEWARGPEGRDEAR